MMDLSGAEKAATDPALGELLEERLRVTLPWYRVWRSRSAAARWVRDLNAVVEQLHADPDARVTDRSTLKSLPPMTRAIALATVALAETPAVAIFDVPDAVAIGSDMNTLIRALSALAPERTTLVLSTTGPLARATEPPSVPGVAHRSIVTLDLNHGHGTEPPTALRSVDTPRAGGLPAHIDRTASTAGTRKGSTS